MAIVGNELAIDGEISKYMKRTCMLLPETSFVRSESSFGVEWCPQRILTLETFHFYPQCDALKFSEASKGYCDSARSQDLWLGSE